MKSKIVFSSFFKVFVVLSVVFGLSGVAKAVDLTITKTDVDGGCVAVDNLITYDICYDNQTGGDVNNAAIVDPLADDVDFVSADSGGTYDVNTHTVTWDLGTVSSGQTCVELVVEVAAPNNDGVIVNEATIISDETDDATAVEETAFCCDADVHDVKIHKISIKTINYKKECMACMKKMVKLRKEKQNIDAMPPGPRKWRRLRKWRRKMRMLKIHCRKMMRSPQKITVFVRNNTTIMERYLTVVLYKDGEEVMRRRHVNIGNMAQNLVVYEFKPKKSDCGSIKWTAEIIQPCEDEETRHDNVSSTYSRVPCKCLCSNHKVKKRKK